MISPLFSFSAPLTNLIIETCIIIIIIICIETINIGQATVILREKGNCTSSGDSLHTCSGQTVHQDCRKRYCNPNIIKRKNNKYLHLQQQRQPELLVLNSIFQENCLFCAHPARVSGKKRGYGVFPVRTLDFQVTIQQICRERCDDWAKEVQGRLEYKPTEWA